MPTKIDPVRASRKKDRSALQNGGNGHAGPTTLPEIPDAKTLNAHGRNENGVRERNMLLAAIVDNNPLASVVMDSSNRVQFCNAAFERIFGCRLAEIAGRDIDDFIAAPEFVREAADFSRRTLAGESIQAATCRQRVDGTLVDVEVHAAPLMLQGKLAGIFAVYEEITERKRADEQLRAAESRYRQLVEQLPAITYVAEFGTNGNWEYVSPQIASFLGFSQSEWLSANGQWLRQVHPEDRKQVMEAEKHSERTGENIDIEYRMLARDGRVVWFRDRAIVGRTNDGRKMQHGFMLDITERKDAEAALMKLSRQTNMILNSAGDGIFGLDQQGRPTFVNRAAARMLGYDPEEIIGREGHALWHHTKSDGTAYPEAECGLIAVLRDGATRHGSSDVFWRKDGSSFPVEFISTAIREGEEVTGAVVTFRDITARQRAEKAQKQAEERFRSIFENAVEGIYQSTPDGRFISVNPAMAKMFGYASPEEMIECINDIGTQLYIDSEQREEFKRAMEQFDVVERFETRVLQKDRTKIWISETSRAVRNVVGRVCYYEGTLEDVTSLKRAEAERQVSFEIIHAANVTDNLDELLHRIHESLKRVLCAENCFVALQDPVSGMFHFPFFVDRYDSAPPPQKIGRSCTTYVFRKGEAMLIPQSVFDSLVAQGEVELVGTPSPSWLGVPLRTPSATIGVLVVQHYEDERAYTHRDLEFLASVGGQIALAIERKRAETALRESEARLRLLIEQLPAVLWTTDGEMRFTSSVGAGLARLGLKPQEVVGKSLFEFFNTDDRTFPPIAAHRKALAGESVTYHTEWSGGSYACHAEPLRNGDGEISGVISMALDITDRKQLEAQLRQAQKMEAVGRLAGGIAHDFNNLLMVIQGYTELLLDRLGNEHPLRRNAEQIHDASQRAASLTRQLLAFSRKQMLAPQVLNIRSVVSDMESILRRLIGEDIDLVTVNPADLWRVRADRSQVEQVILNLAVNSRDAMPNGGKVTIETANVELDSSYSRHAVVEPGEYVMIAVSDTGCGMDADTQAHVFEPFFTTKEKGKGTGLGLATVYGIVKQSGGYIWVYSEIGKGATFKVYLPRVRESEKPAQQKPETKLFPLGCETILLVEDEKGVRELAREYLEQIGYVVLEAENAQKAIDVARSHSGAIDLLFTDVVMGGMSGRQLAEEMHKLRPGVKILYMSGYTDEAIVHHGILGRGMTLLQKPFTLNSLALKVRDTLDLPQEQ
ncbi:MAG: PAS domain S-box protein [Candidatus Acidiferrales bacterium]